MRKNKIRNCVLLLFFFSICLVLYFNVLHYPFILDDKYLITENKHVKDLSITKIFTSDVFHVSSEIGYNNTDKYYRPLQILSYAFEYPIWKLNPFGYRLDNIILQSINGFLLFLIIFLLFKDKILALLSGIFFCVHPSQVCLVTFVAGRSNLLPPSKPGHCITPANMISLTALKVLALGWFIFIKGRTHEQTKNAYSALF